MRPPSILALGGGAPVRARRPPSPAKPRRGLWPPLGPREDRNLPSNYSANVAARILDTPGRLCHALLPRWPTGASDRGPEPATTLGPVEGRAGHFVPPQPGPDGPALAPHREAVPTAAPPDGRPPLPPVPLTT
jgi:hypothetical protein